MHVEDENGVVHDQVVVVIYHVDIMEQVQATQRQMHVQLENIVKHDQVVVLIVLINQPTHITLVMHVITVVVGHVMHHIINIEVHVIHVVHDIIQVHDQRVVLHVQMDQVIRIILEIEQVMIVHGHVILDTI
jgi:hypothetical protein